MKDATQMSTNLTLSRATFEHVFAGLLFGSTVALVLAGVLAMTFGA
jgi:hypothetical protein